ncbi:MAG: CHAT domain-containing protein [Deltaproteobacteria bacterium]|nr:CHAT domain-containing protein [Deltaproteobacteria bacterium]
MQSWTIIVFPKSDQLTLLRLFDPAGHLADERELPRADVDRWVDEVERTYRDRHGDLERLGDRLYEWLDGPAKRWFNRILEHPDGAVLRIDTAEERLRHLPWELLRGPIGYLHLNFAKPFTVIRRVRNTRREFDRANRPPRLLFVASSPLDVEPVLDFEAEERCILEATRRTTMELVVEESGSLRGIGERVTDFGRDYFDIIHLTGHANARDGRSFFAMEDDTGYLNLVDANEIARVLGARWPRLVFLSGCKTGFAQKRGDIPPLAESIVAAGAPAVLGWALPVGDQSATMAAQYLYEELAGGRRLDEAVASARARLADAKSTSWHLLRFYGDDTEANEFVTPPATAGRSHLKIRGATQEFLDNGAQVGVCRRENFVGRRRAIQAGLRVLRANPSDPEFHEGLRLHGMGGLGKSSLAARLCDRLANFTRVVCVGRLDEPAILSRLKNLLASPEVIALLDMTTIPLQNRLAHMFDGPLRDAKAIFVLDDFEQNLERASDGGHMVRPDALTVLVALMNAIRETASDCRVIVTSRHRFPLAGPASLHDIGLDSLRDADLEKKAEMLSGFVQLGNGDVELAEKALAVCAGNPRLMERMNLLLNDASIDLSGLIQAMEAKVAEFREDILLEKLWTALPARARLAVAHVGLFEIPAERDWALAAMPPDLDAHLLDRAVDIGLVECGLRDAGTERLFFVSGLVKPLFENLLTPEARAAAAGRAARTMIHPYRERRLVAFGLDRSLELLRVSLIARDSELAIEVSNSIAVMFQSNHRYREAAFVSRETLALVDDYRIRHNLARALEILGEVQAAHESYRWALENCPDSDDETVLKEKSAIMGNLASLEIQSGNHDRARILLQDSHAISKSIGDDRSCAVTMGKIADILQSRGELDEALRIRREEQLPVYERLGDVRSRAVTMGKIADILQRRGELDEALRTLRENVLPAFERLGDVRSRAICLAMIALALAMKDKDRNKVEARNLYLEAARLAGSMKIPEEKVFLNEIQRLGLDS